MHLGRKIFRYWASLLSSHSELQVEQRLQFLSHFAGFNSPPETRRISLRVDQFWLQVRFI